MEITPTSCTLATLGFCAAGTIIMVLMPVPSVSAATSVTLALSTPPAQSFLINKEENIMEDIKDIEKTENDKKLNEYKPKKKKINIIMIIIDILIILLVGYFVIGYLNFSKIKDGKDPVFVVDTKTYDYDSNTVITVYDNKIYKVVKQENKDKNIIYSLKLWFMDDVKVTE